MNVKNTKVNVRLLREAIGNLNLKSSAEAWNVELFNTGEGFRNTKFYTGMVAIYVLVSLAFTGYGKTDLGGVISIIGFTFMWIKMLPNVFAEKIAEERFNSIKDDVEENEQYLIAHYPGFVFIKAEAAEMEAAGRAHSYCIDWIRKETLLTIQEIKNGDESARQALKLKFAAAIGLFGNRFDLGQGYDLFFNGKIVSHMRFFTEGLK